MLQLIYGSSKNKEIASYALDPQDSFYTSIDYHFAL